VARSCQPPVIPQRAWILARDVRRNPAREGWGARGECSPIRWFLEQVQSGGVAHADLPVRLAGSVPMAPGGRFALRCVIRSASRRAGPSGRSAQRPGTWSAGGLSAAPGDGLRGTTWRIAARSAWR
jgi:hypothetical protein